MAQRVRAGPQRTRYDVSMNQKRDNDEFEPLSEALSPHISSRQDQTWETKCAASDLEIIGYPGAGSSHAVRYGS